MWNKGIKIENIFKHCLVWKITIFTIFIIYLAYACIIYLTLCLPGEVDVHVKNVVVNCDCVHRTPLYHFINIFRWFIGIEIIPNVFLRKWVAIKKKKGGKQGV